jgi:hypothetical protein
MTRQHALRILVALFAVLVLIGVAPAHADPPSPEDPCEGTWVNGWCVLPPLPYTVFEDPPHPPVPQSGDTGSDGEQFEAGTYYSGCRERTSSLSPYSVVHKSCLEWKDNPNGPGELARVKTRFTFWYNSPTGQSPAYGNVRWDVRWNSDPGPNQTNPLWRRVYVYPGTTGPVYYAFTSSRPDAIGAHTTVGYSQWGCSQQLGSLYNYGHVRNHYVRMPAGQLFGPFTQQTGGKVNICAT